jgi:multimeric flavodoxin WrbA
MKIVGILGSGRRGGNTEFLLDVALSQAQEHGATTDKISLKETSVAPCDGCLGCVKTGECVIHDDAQGIYEKMLEADGIVWSTPVYFWSMTAQTKILMDRTYALQFPTLQLANKVGGVIAVAASRGCMSTANIFQQYFNYNHMFSTEYAWGYAIEKGSIKDNEFAINTTKVMIRQMIALISANLKYPKEFDLPMPRFVREKCSR